MTDLRETVLIKRDFAHYGREVGQGDRNLADLASKGNKWLLRFAFTNLE